MTLEFVEGQVDAMKKLQLFIIFSIIFLCCVSCAKYQKQQAAPVVNSYTFPAFNKVAISGNARVELTNNGGRTSLYCSGIKRDLDGVNASVKGDTLYLSSASNVPIIRLNSGNLKVVKVMGNAYVGANNFNTRSLGIIASGAGSITLQGRIGLTTINQMGSGKVDVKWIDSSKLVVGSDSRGPIYLAGVVKQLEVKLRDQSYLEARYLRAETAEVLATNRSQAHVVAIKTLNAYADESSNVYYHNHPQQINEVSKDSGNVFLMEEVLR